MEISQARAFLAVASEGGFSAAARRLYRTQPAITMAVQKLEREVGDELFERAGRGVRLTRAGQVLRENLGPLMEQWEAVRGRLRDALDPVPQGTVRIGADEAAALYLLAGPLRAFLKDFPGVEPAIRCLGARETVAALRGGEIDFGVAPVSSAPPDLAYRPFSRSDRLLLVPRSFSRLTSGRLTLEKLARCPILLPPKGSPLHQAVDRAFHARGLEYRAALEASGWETLKQFAGLGLGVAVVPGFCLSRGDRRLIVRPARSLFGRDEYGLLLPRGRALSAAASLLLRSVSPRSPVG